MAVLTKAQILLADDRKSTTVPVPEWGGEVIVKTLGGTERDSMEAEIVQTNGPSTARNLENFRSRLLVRAIVDDKGERIFTNAEIGELAKKSGAVLDRLYDAAVELNKISAKDVEELAKNSEAGPSAGSGL